jgi:hypothetical protein
VSEEERAKFRRYEDVVARIRRDFGDRPLSEGAVGSTEAVDALLAGTDALRSQADAERQAAARAHGDHRQCAEREARASQYERQADLILELDREIEPPPGRVDRSP